MSIKTYIFYIGFILLGWISASQANHCKSWEQWDNFKHAFMTEDGRIIDYSSKNKITTSEGQSYALFFSLVAGDKESFNKILKWTSDNLANGQLGKVLPAWKWGKAENGEWRVLDENSASDSDLWISYSLLEAGRLWNRSDYTLMGKQLANQILHQEVNYLPGLGATLLPAPYGFNAQNTVWRLNLSYMPIQLFRYLANYNKQWNFLVESSDKAIKSISKKGFVPNWVEFEVGKGIKTDREEGPIGSYSAIRTYLWVGMMHDADPIKKSLISNLYGMQQYIQEKSFPPLHTNALTGEAGGYGSAGFSAALLPFMASTNHKNTMPALIEQAKLVRDERYYSNVLSLFGLGWYLNKFRFAENGSLQLPHSMSCH